MLREVTKVRSAGGAPPEDTDLLARIAWHYYRDDMTQQAIGARLGMSRQRIMRALRRARELGIVDIRLEHPSLARLALEKRLTERFVRPGEILGTSWGRTLHEVAVCLPRRPVRNLSVVLLNGALVRGPTGHGAFDLASAIADRFQAKLTCLLVPAIVDSAGIRRAITSDRAVAEALALARRATKAILGIGDVTDDAALIRAGALTRSGMAHLRALGAVGDILGRFYDLHGRPVGGGLDDRVIGLTFPELHRIPLRIAVAAGPSKVPAILGALRGGHVNVLVSDEATVRGVLRKGGIEEG